MQVMCIVMLFVMMVTIPIVNSQGLFKIKQETNINENVCDLLIISPSRFLKSLQPLVDHKNQHGVRTKLVSLNLVYNRVIFGNDKAEKIKLFIKNAIEESGIKYVLLVGGKFGQFNHWWLPVRYVYTGCKFESHFLSDLYYADIYDSEGNFSSWDQNKDGKYSEWVQGEQPEDKYLDLRPDIAVGRLPCRTNFEVKIMVNKIINYEKTTYGKSWFKKIVAVAGDTYPEYKNPKWKGYEGEYYADLIIENLTGFNATRLYTSYGTYSHWEDLIDPISKGCGFLYFGGHGSPLAWTNHFPNDKNRTKSFTVYKMFRLKNKNKLPVCVVGGCHNSQFDVSIFNYLDKKKKARGENVFECWSWVMTSKIGGGSIATIGCSALGYTKEDKESFVGGIDICEVEFFKQYGQNNVSILGDAWKLAVDYYAKTYPINWDSELTNDSWIDMQIVQNWILFGDPSLKIGGYQ